ncbi:MAG TPA: AMP-binding protein, partial [Thermoleophilia bacterium]|nr:AMP-binding protein [Thermoleophilia bacterium]
MPEFRLLDGAVPYRDEDAEDYLAGKWWSGLTLSDWLDRAADMHPDKEAFVDLKSRLTYGGAREKVDRLAVGLMRLGVRPLERVLVQ